MNCRPAVPKPAYNIHNPLGLKMTKYLRLRAKLISDPTLNIATG